MKRTKLVTVVAAVVALAGAGQAWRSRSALNETSASMAAAQAARAADEAEAERLERRIAVLSLHRTQLEAERAKLTADRKSSSPPPASPRPQIGPEMQVWLLQRFKAGLPLEYGPLYRTLGLSPAQVERFEALLAERMARKGDIVSAAVHQHLAATDPAIVTLQQKEDERFQAALVDELGAEALRQWLEFDRDAATRGFVKELVGELAFTPTPLTADQAARLIETLRDPNAQDSADRSFRPDFILSRAQPVLTPSQLAALKARLITPGPAQAIAQLSAFIDRARSKDPAGSGRR